MGCQYSNNVCIPKIRNSFPTRLLLKDEITLNNPQTNSNSREKDTMECLVDKSIKKYQDLIEQNPEIHCALDGLGNPEDQIGYYEGRVQQWYQEQRQKGLIIGNPYDSLSLCYSLKEDISQGVKWYKKMIEKYPHLYQLHFGLGNLYYKVDKYEQAQQKYRKCIELKPQFSKAYQTIANIYCYKKFNNDLAKEWSRFALKLNPMNDYAGLIYTLTQENIENRINLLMKIRQKCPNYARLCNAFGAAFFENNHIEKAIQWYLKGYSINPNYYAVCCSLGLAYTQKNDNNSSLKTTEQIQRDKQINGQQSAKSQKILNISNNMEEAQKWYGKCIQLNPNIFIANYELAMINLSKQQLSKQQQGYTIKRLQKCIQLDPSNIECYISMAKIYIKQKQHVAAVTYIQKALQMDPNNKDCLQMMETTKNNKKLL